MSNEQTGSVLPVREFIQLFLSYKNNRNHSKWTHVLQFTNCKREVIHHILFVVQTKKKEEKKRDEMKIVCIKIQIISHSLFA